jgi:hypothetical protein
MLPAFWSCATTPLKAPHSDLVGEVVRAALRNFPIKRVHEHMEEHLQWTSPLRRARLRGEIFLQRDPELRERAWHIAALQEVEAQLQRFLQEYVCLQGLALLDCVRAQRHELLWQMELLPSDSPYLRLPLDRDTLAFCDALQEEMRRCSEAHAVLSS